MNQPGQSLFQGAGSLHLNTSANRQEEEEDLIDQQRRRNEVQQRLDNEFGDLSDDNDDTAVSNAQSFAECPQPIDHGGNHINVHLNNGNQMARDTDKELAITKIRFKEQQELEDLRRRLAVCESEKQRAFMARQQSHELLVESKGKISEQEDVIQKLKTKLHGVEQDKTQLETELEHKKTLLSDAQMRAQMYERTVGITADRHVDHLVKQANDRCQAQVDMMNQQIESLRTQLEDRSREVKSITTRYTELQRSREALLVDKSETINQLSRSLEDSQRHCQMLMAKNDGQTEVRLHSRIRELSDQVDEMHKTIGQLEKSLHTAHSDLDSMACIINDTGDAVKRSPLGNLTSNKSPMQDTKIRLQNELQRCLSDQQKLRTELKQHQERLHENDLEIHNLRESKNGLMVEVERQKYECNRYVKRVKLLQTDLNRLFRLYGIDETADQDYAEKVIADIEHEFSASKQKCVDLQSQQETLTKDLTDVRSECNALEKRLKELCATKDLEKGQADDGASTEKATKQPEENCVNLTALHAESNGLRRQLADLNHQLQISNDLIVDLKRNLDMKHDNEKLLSDLQAKADHFDKFIQSQTDLQNGQQQPARCSSAPQTLSPNSSSSAAALRKDEERIAKVVAAKLKRIEDTAQAQETQLRSTIHQLQMALDKHQSALALRSSEVDMLKHAILTERQQSKETLAEAIGKQQQAAKTFYLERLTTVHMEKETLSKRVDELMADHKSVADDLGDLRAQRETWRREHESWAREKKQLLMDAERLRVREQQQQSMRDEMAEAKEQISKLETKYRMIKKTAAGYKKYAEDKDKHIESENQRVKLAFEEATRKMMEKLEKT